MKKIIFGLVAVSCLVGSNGILKTNKEANFLEPEVKRAHEGPSYYNGVIYCKNSCYFDHLINCMPKLNPNKNNGIVIIQQLLGYYDTLIDDQIIPENYENNTYEFIADPDHPSPDQFMYSPTTTIAYYNYLKDLYTGLKYKYDESKGTTHAQDKTLLRKALKEYNYYGFGNTNFYVEVCENNLSDRLNGYSVRLAEEEIWHKENPVIVRKDGTVAICYAFNNDYVWGYTWDVNNGGGSMNGMIRKPRSWLKNSQVIAVHSASFENVCAYSDNYIFDSFKNGKTWMSGNGHIQFNWNGNGYQEYYLRDF